jgi:DNA (cytosine-5)-methyltransferase 1
VNVVDLFAGGGGASEGIRQALGVSPWLAINHDEAAIAMHAANHPETLHLTEDLFRVRPQTRRGGIDLLWASPDCTHHSRAKGGKPRETGRRLLAWVVVEWARAVTPRVICLENVQEFRDWGPLDDAGHPISARKGETFREFMGALQLAGYRVEHRVLCAADYGAPTSRRRLFLVGRRDGEAIVWPEPTHGPGRALPWRAAAECIDWSIPCPSIFDRVRPLAAATQRRIAEGIRRYVLTAARPFLVRTDMTSDGRLRGIGGLGEPLRTVTTATGHALVAPTLVQTGYGEREGQAPRALDLQTPLGTVVAGGPKHALVAAFLAKHYGGVVGQPLDHSIGTVTAIDHHAVVEAGLERQPSDRARQVAAFLCAYYNTGVGQDLRAPLRTVPTLDRFGLVTVDLDGEPYVLADIGMRMLQPRELATAQGFADSYVLTGNKREQVARIGNSVCPPVARAVVAAQFGRELEVADTRAPQAEGRDQVPRAERGGDRGGPGRQGGGGAVSADTPPPTPVPVYPLCDRDDPAELVASGRSADEALKGLVLALLILVAASAGAPWLYRWGRADGLALQARCSATCEQATGATGTWEEPAGLCRCELAGPGMLPCDLMASGVCFGSPYEATWATTTPPVPR